MFSTREESDLPLPIRMEINKKARAMKMSDVMRDYELELIQPKSNLLMGNIVQLMLIQMQFMKKEIMVAMGKMDTVLKANHFNMEAMALVPAIFAAGVAYNLAKRIIRRLTVDDKGRRDTRSELQITLRDIDQSLNHVAHKSDIDETGSEVYRMELHELGNLALLLHRFDEQLNIYFRFGNVRPEIRYRLEEDLEELMMEEFSLMQRIRVVERIFRSYEVFQPTRQYRF
jgi:nuclear-control-of-ATPase protein 2